MDFVNAHQDILELHWVFVFYNKQGLELAHPVEYLCLVNVYLQLYVVPTNTGVEVFALVLMDTIKLMANVSLFNLLTYALFILNQMESIVFVNKVTTQSHRDYVIDAHLVPIGMERLAAMEIMDWINVNQVGYGIQLKLAAIILEAVQEMNNLMEQTVDVSKVSI